MPYNLFIAVAMVQQPAWPVYLTEGGRQASPFVNIIFLQIFSASRKFTQISNIKTI